MSAYIAYMLMITSFIDFPSLSFQIDPKVAFPRRAHPKVSSNNSFRPFRFKFVAPLLAFLLAFSPELGSTLHKKGLCFYEVIRDKI
jgi:hypothetical protein